MKYSTISFDCNKSNEKGKAEHVNEGELWIIRVINVLKLFRYYIECYQKTWGHSYLQDAIDETYQFHYFKIV